MKTKEEIAYKLGQMISDGFYGSPLWNPNEDAEPFYIEYYDWSYEGKTKKDEDEEWRHTFLGSFKNGSLETDSEKIEYIKGAISKNGKIEDGEITFSFANGSVNSKRIISYIQDICKNHTNETWDLDSFGKLSFAVNNHTLGCPICTKLTIKLSDNYLKLFK